MTETPVLTALVGEILGIVKERNTLRGEIHRPKNSQPNRKRLTKPEVEAIREMKRRGESNRGIADVFDINPTTVSRIVRGQYHKETA